MDLSFGVQNNFLTFLMLYALNYRKILPSILQCKPKLVWISCSVYTRYERGVFSIYVKIEKLTPPPYEKEMHMESVTV